MYAVCMYSVMKQLFTIINVSLAISSYMCLFAKASQIIKREEGNSELHTVLLLNENTCQ